jgi:SpoVK/Ycf46/Vps4 family AAA+-type ATPase
LAEPVAREVTADAIILNPMVSEELDRFVLRARQRETLWDGLGATLKQTRNPGVRALFVGDSGTGKTLAASYVATLLGAPLYRVDLAAVMNKYIGESEKNLSLLLDQAAASDVVLLFDEADALFGRRTEGKETGERFANMLTHFLLTRIENHPGIVVLTSNNRERIDEAFNRRLDLIIEFPPPGFEERRRLWESHLGDRGPGDAVYRFLASGCDFSGGQLRNVVLTAVSLAGSGPVSGAHLLAGLAAEYRKIGRDLPAKLTQLGRL